MAVSSGLRRWKARTSDAFRHSATAAATESRLTHGRHAAERAASSLASIADGAVSIDQSAVTSGCVSVWLGRRHATAKQGLQDHERHCLSLRQALENSKQTVNHVEVVTISSVLTSYRLGAHPCVEHATPAVRHRRSRLWRHWRGQASREIADDVQAKASRRKRDENRVIVEGKTSASWRKEDEPSGQRQPRKSLLHSHAIPLTASSQNKALRIDLVSNLSGA